MPEKLRMVAEKIVLSMYIEKIKVISSNDTIPIVGNNILENVEEYIYSGHAVKLEKENHTAEKAYDMETVTNS